MTKLALLIAALATLAGCNTIAGVGEDISGGARTVQNGVLVIPPSPIPPPATNNQLQDTTPKPPPASPPSA